MHVCPVMSDSLWPHGLTVACQAPPSMGFSRQEHWSGLPFHSPGDLPHPGTEPTAPASPALAGGFSTSVLPGKPRYKDTTSQMMGNGSVGSEGLNSSLLKTFNTFVSSPLPGRKFPRLGTWSSASLATPTTKRRRAGRKMPRAQPVFSPWEWPTWPL